MRNDDAQPAQEQDPLLDRLDRLLDAFRAELRQARPAWHVSITRPGTD